MTSPSNPKQKVRDEIRQRIRHVTSVLRANWSKRAMEQLLSVDAIAKASIVFLFASLPSEIDTDPIFERLRSSGKRVAMPILFKNDPLMHAVFVEKLEQLHMNPLGFREPPDNQFKRLEPLFLDVAIVPGVAFDRSGHRLGRGQGCYDVFFQRTKSKAVRIGLFFSIQEVEKVPIESFDEPLDWIVTEKEIIRCNTRPAKT